MASARSIVEILERQGITDVIGVPDNSSAALYSLLAQHPRVADFVDAPPDGGGWGATIVRLKR